MSMRVDGLPSQYNGYKVNVNRVKQEIEKQKNSNISLCDQAEISAEGKKALESRMSALAGERHMEPHRRSSSSAPRRDSTEPRPRGCSGLGEPPQALAASRVRAREGAGCGSVGDVSGA